MGDYTDFDARPDGPPQKSGGGFLKFCLICGCIVLALLAAAGGFFMYSMSQMFTMDPQKIVTKVEQEILPGSDVPANYEGMIAVKVPFTPVQFAVVVPQGMQQQANNNNLPLMIWVCTMGPGMNAQQMQQQMQQSMQQGGQGGANTQVQVEAENQKVLKVRGQDVTFTEIVGQNQGTQIKQLIGVIPRTAGSSEQVMLMFMGKADVFDQATVDAFLSSIK